MNAIKLYEMGLNDIPESKTEVLNALRGNRNDKQWKKLCASQVHQQLNNAPNEIPRRLNGQKMGLRKRIEHAVSNGLIEIRPLGVWYL